MAFAGFDAELLGALEAAEASPAQAYLLQAILQGIEPDTPLSPGMLDLTRFSRPA